MKISPGMESIGKWVAAGKSQLAPERRIITPDRDENKAKRARPEGIVHRQRGRRRGTAGSAAQAPTHQPKRKNAASRRRRRFA
jgi:hypothetical protein